MSKVGLRSHWKAIVSGTVAGLVLGLLIAGTLGAGDGRPRSGEELYRRLVDAAQRGDQRAAQEVAAIEAYISERGLTPADLGVPAEAPGVEVRAGVALLSVRDMSPWRITIDNRTTFRGAADVTEYVAARNLVLGSFAALDPAREVEVVVHPRGRMSPSAFLGSVVCPCDGVSLIVDVYGPEGWMMSSGMGISGDVRQSAERSEAEILDLAAMSLDIFPGVSRADLRAEVRTARLLMTARSADLTSRVDRVLLVDLTADLLDAYDGRAAVVEVAGMPDVAEAYRRLVMGDPIGTNPVEPARK